MTRDDIVREALAWEGTPLGWQKAVRGIATDCRGWIWAVARDLGMPEADVPEVAVANYSRGFSGEQMLAGLTKALRRTDTPLPGDLLAIRIRPADEFPRHLGMLIGGGRMMHALPGFKRLVSVPVGKSRPIHSYWTWPSLDAAE